MLTEDGDPGICVLFKRRSGFDPLADAIDEPLAEAGQF